jgi:hypothetical protein
MAVVSAGEGYATNGVLTRREVIGATAAALVVVVIAPTSVAAASANTFALDAGACETSCSSCRACQSHAANKLFRTDAAAEIGRAHAGCNCTVAVGQSLSQGALDQIFQLSDMADRRNAATASLLQAEVEQHSVPLVTGVVPIAVLAGGAALVWARAHRRVVGVE